MFIILNCVLAQCTIYNFVVITDLPEEKDSDGDSDEVEFSGELPSSEEEGDDDDDDDDDVDEEELSG